MKSFFLIDDLMAAAMAKLHEASPRTYLNKKTPPFLDHSRHPRRVRPLRSGNSACKLFKERRIPVELITVQDGVHGVMNWEKDPQLPYLQAADDRLVKEDAQIA